MNRIVLIGNGFDLAHGLKTSYKDFIDDYLKTVINRNYHYYQDKNKNDYYFNVVNSSPVLSDLRIKEGSPYYTNLIEALRSYRMRNIYGNINTINLEINNSFLQDISPKSYNNWFDLESEYYNRLLNIAKNDHENKNDYEPIKILNNEFGYIKTKLEEYLQKVMNNHNQKVSQKIKKIIYAPFDIRDLVIPAREEIVQIENKRIENYLDKNMDPDFYYISPKTIEYIDADEEYFRQHNYDLMQILMSKELALKHFNLLPNNVLLLNFNYTNLEKIYSKHKEIKTEVNHIHGELYKKDNPIIFGYGDEIDGEYEELEKRTDKTYLDNIKSINYLDAENYRNLLNYLESDKYQVIILGHSCGNSDRTLLNTLFEHKNCASIKPYYFKYKTDDTNEIKDNYSDIIRNISRMFKDKSLMRDRVVNKKYCDWFSQKI